MNALQMEVICTNLVHHSYATSLLSLGIMILSEVYTMQLVKHSPYQLSI